MTIYITFVKLQNYRGRKQFSGFQRLGMVGAGMMTQETFWCWTNSAPCGVGVTQRMCSFAHPCTAHLPLPLAHLAASIGSRWRPHTPLTISPTSSLQTLSPFEILNKTRRSAIPSAIPHWLLRSPH